MKRRRDILQEAVGADEPEKEVRRVLYEGVQVTTIPKYKSGPGALASTRAVAIARQWQWFQKKARLLRSIMEALRLSFPHAVATLIMASGQIISFYEAADIIALAQVPE